MSDPSNWIWLVLFLDKGGMADSGPVRKSRGLRTVSSFFFF